MGVDVIKRRVLPKLDMGLASSGGGFSSTFHYRDQRTNRKHSSARLPFVIVDVLARTQYSN
jgi:hypothetical protein